MSHGSLGNRPAYIEVCIVVIPYPLCRIAVSAGEGWTVRDEPTYTAVTRTPSRSAPTVTFKSAPIFPQLRLGLRARRCQRVRSESASSSTIRSKERGKLENGSGKATRRGTMDEISKVR